MLQKGAQLPKFSVVNQNSEILTEENFKNKKVIFFFYPKDNTPGCTAEACNLRDAYQDLKDKGYELYGISADSPKKHQSFIEKYSLPFPLFADENQEMIKAFGAWGLKKFMGKEYEGILRSTFIIENALITQVIDKVKTKDHAAQIFELV